MTPKIITQLIVKYKSVTITCVAFTIIVSSKYIYIIVNVKKIFDDTYKILNFKKYIHKIKKITRSNTKKTIYKTTIRKKINPKKQPINQPCHPLNKNIKFCFRATFKLR